MALGGRTGRRSRDRLSVVIRDLLRQETVILLALWIALEVPVVCQHGPMSLFDPGVHDGMYQGAIQMDMQTDPRLAHIGQSSLAEPQAAGGAGLGSLALLDIGSQVPVSGYLSSASGCCTLARHEISTSADTFMAMIFSLSAGVMLVGSIKPPLETTSVLILTALGLQHPLLKSPLDPPPRLV
jgi:hypothetical protein